MWLAMASQKVCPPGKGQKKAKMSQQQRTQRSPVSLAQNLESISTNQRASEGGRKAQSTEVLASHRVNFWPRKQAGISPHCLEPSALNIHKIRQPYPSWLWDAQSPKSSLPHHGSVSHLHGKSKSRARGGNREREMDPSTEAPGVFQSLWAPGREQ